MIFFPLTPWTNISLNHLAHLVIHTSWKQESMFRKPYSTSKCLSGISPLKSEDCIAFQRFTLLRGMCTKTQPWMGTIYYFVGKVSIHHGKTKIVASWWNVVNSDR